MKRMFYLVLCLALTFVFVFSPVSAARPEPEEFVSEGIPVGGGIINSGHYAVRGYSSGGTLGKAEVWNWIEYSNGDLQDSVTAYTESDVSAVTSAQIRTLAWYTDAEIGATTTSSEQFFTSIPAQPGNINVTTYAPNAFLTKGTAAHLVNYPTRGTWCCGTTIIVKPVG